MIINELHEMLNKIGTSNDGEKIQAIDAQAKLENLEKVSIGDVPDEAFEEFVKKKHIKPQNKKKS